MQGTKPPAESVGMEHCRMGLCQELRSQIELLKQSNLELEGKRREIQALLDGIPDLMMVLTENLLIRQVNDVFMTWYPQDAPIGRPCYEVLHGRAARCEQCPAVQALELEGPVKKLRLYRVGGEPRHFEVIASPFASSLDGERRILLFKRDLTLEKQLQAQFHLAEKMATLGTLAAGVAHEINNPLAAIHGFAQGLQRRLGLLQAQGMEPGLFRDFQEYTETIISECQRCRDIVHTLLTFSRPTTISMGCVDLNKCVTDTLFILKYRFKERPRILIYTDLCPNLPTITGDESQLKQVILNLLSNAFDAIAESGSIRICTLARSGEVELIIADTGCGIAEEVQEKLFEPFYTTKAVGQGVGIGLSTCYSIVQQHGGRIRVRSRLGKGAAFHVTLPEAAAS